MVDYNSQVTQRRKKNIIRKLLNEDGGETEVSQELGGIARLYFQKLFSTGQMGNSAHLLSGIDRCIQDEDNNKLNMNHTKEEIEALVFEMGPTKAPREDKTSCTVLSKILGHS